MKVVLSLGVLLLAAVLAGAGGYHLGSRDDDDATGTNVDDQASVAWELTIQDLETSYGVDPPPSANRFLSNIVVIAPAAIATRLGAYRAGAQVVLAPKGWTGSGMVGGNGNTSLGLHPQDGSAEGPGISVYLASPGTLNAICPAAPYNPLIRDKWDELCGSPFGPAPTAAPGLTDETGHIVRYTLQADSGLETVGASFSDVQDLDGFNYGWFNKIDVVLPTEDHDLAMTIVENFLAESNR